MMLETRVFALSALGALGSAFAAAEGAPATAPVKDGADYIVERITPRAHYLRQEIGVREAPSGNVTIFEQSDGYVVVDTGSTHRGGERVAEHIDALGAAKPVIAIVITHWHGDHPLGAGGLIARWPDALVIASQRTREEMIARYGDQYPLEPGSDAMEAYRLRNRESRAAVMQRGENQPLAPEMESGRQRVLYDLDRLLEERPGETLVLPNVTFTEQLTLHDSDYPIEVRFLGKANTDGDVIVWAPGDRIVAAGDIVVSPMPYAFGSYPREWVETIGRLRALDFAYLVPGHGELQRNDRYLKRLSRLIVETENQIASLLERGVPEEEVGNLLEVEAFREEFAGSNPYHRDLFDRFFVSPMVDNVVRARSE